jgi:phosphate starvation-inducible PhoH-like protein
LLEAMRVLKNVEGISFQTFDESDVVRHHLVQRIIRAYDEFKTANEQQLSLGLDRAAAESNMLMNVERINENRASKPEPTLSPDVTPPQSSPETRARD